jgi:hypothetical protein
MGLNLNDNSRSHKFLFLHSLFSDIECMKMQDVGIRENERHGQAMPLSQE